MQHSPPSRGALHLRRCLAFALAVAAAAASPPAAALEGLDGIVENTGQCASDALFVGRSATHGLLFGRHGVTHVPLAAGHDPVELKLLGANPDPEVTAASPLPGRFNIVRGADPATWRHDLTRYGAVHYSDVYPGVDLVFRIDGGRLKRDLLIAPGADPADIAFRYAGAPRVTLGPNGELHIDTGAALLTDAAPVAWQERDGRRDMVAADYVIDPEQRVSFALGSYDPALPLIIDPGLDFAMYVGGADFDEVNAVHSDILGNIYLAGSTSSVDLPATLGALQTNTRDGETYLSTDAFVMQLDATGKLVWATFFGGKTDKFPSSICLDVDPPTGDPLYTCNSAIPSPWGLGGVDVALALAVNGGDVYVAGQTNAIDLPIVPAFNGVQSKLSNLDFDPARPDRHYSFDAFLVRLSSTGALQYSTYFGGTGTDVARGVAVDSDGHAWIAGVTSSADLPTKDPIHPYRGGPRVGLSDNDTDGFVARIDTGSLMLPASRLLFASPLGGYGFDEINAIVADPLAPNVYVGGTTATIDFPGAPANGFANEFRGAEDGFIATLRSDASGTPRLVFRTYLGGVGSDEVGDLALVRDDLGQPRIVAVGTTTSPTIDPAECVVVGDCGSDGQCNLDLEGPRDDAFVLLLDALDAAHPRCTRWHYLGGAANDGANAVSVDLATRDIYLTGTTYSADFPVLAAAQPKKADGRSAGCLVSNPFDCANNSDAFFTRLTADADELLVSSFLGGTGTGFTTDDAGYDIVFGGTPGSRHALIVGQTHSADFPRQSPALTQPAATSDVANGFLVRAPMDIADVRIDSATASPNPVEQGATTVYSVRVANDGPEPTAVRLDANLTGVDLVGLPAGCTQDAATGLLRCSNPAKLARQSSRVYTFNVRAPATSGSVFSTFTAVGTVRDPSFANNEKTLELRVGGVDLAFTTAACAPTTVGFERTFDCTLAVSNDGPEAAHDVAAVVTFRPGPNQALSLVSAGSSPGCTATGTSAFIVSCPLAATLPKGQTSPVVTVRLKTPPLTDDYDARLELSAIASESDNDPANNKRAVVVKVRGPDLSLKTAVATPEPVGLGRALTYDVTVENLGPGDATDPSVAIRFSRDLDPTAGSDARCAAAGSRSLLCGASATGTTVTLAEGDTLSWSVVVTAPAVASVIDASIVASLPLADNPANNSRTVKTHVGWADVEVRAVEVAQPAQGPYGVGRPVTVEATLVNTTAEVDADAVVVEYGAATSAAGFSGATYEHVAASVQATTAGSCVAGPPLRCTFPKIKGGAPGQPGETVTMRVTTKPTRKGEQTHGFRIVSAGTMDPTATNNAGQAKHAVAGYDLVLSQSTPITNLVRGVPARFEAQITNSGPGDSASGVYFIKYDTQDFAWVSLVSHSQSLTCAAVPDDGAIPCDLAPLPAGGGGASVVVELRPKRKGPLSVAFSAEGLYAVDDDNPADNRVAPSLDVDVSDLALGVSVPQTVEVGQAVTFPLTIQNLGRAATDGAQIIHTFPAEFLELDTGPLGTCTASAGKTTCSGTEFPAMMGAPTAAALTYTAKKSGTFASTVLLEDGKGAANDDMDLSNNQRVVTTTVNGPDVRLASGVQDLTNPVGWHRAVKYTFAVENPSTREETGSFSVSVALFGADKVSRIAYATLGGSPGLCAINPTTGHDVTCTNLGGLPKATAGSPPPKVLIEVDAVGLGKGTVQVNAFVTPSKPDPDTTNNQLRPGPVTTVREGYDLVPTLHPDLFQPLRGTSTSPYTLDVTNTREGRAEGVLVELHHYDKRLALNSATATRGTGCTNDPTLGLVTCNLGDLDKGETATVTYTMDAIKEGDAKQLYLVRAPNDAPQENAADDLVNHTTHVVGANLVLTSVTWPTDDLGPEEELDLTVTVANQTPAGGAPPAKSQAVTLTHTGFSPYLKLLSSSVGAASGGAPCAATGASVSCSLGELSSGQTAVVYLRYKAVAAGTFTHQLRVAEPSGTADELPSDNVAPHTDTVTGPDLVVQQATGDAKVGVGRAAPLTVAVKNASTTTLAEGVKIRVAVTSGPAGAVVANKTQPAQCTRISATTVECDIGDLTTGASSPALVTAWDAVDAGALVTRTVTALLGKGTDAKPGDNVVPTDVRTEGPDLAVTVGAPAPTKPARDETFTVTASVDNLKLGRPRDAIIAVAADASIRFVSGAVSGGATNGTCKQTSNGAQCDLAPGATYPLTATFTLRGTKAGTFSLVTVGTTRDDEDPSNNTPPHTPLVIDGADLVIAAASPNPGEVVSGQDLTFTVDLRNDGPAATGTYRLVHSYDFRFLAFKSGSPLGSCTNDAVAGRTVCTLGGLSGTAPANVQEFSLTYTGKRAGDLIHGLLAEEPGQTDPTPGNNDVPVQTKVRGADLGVVLTDAPDPVARGATITYQAVVTNYGPATTESVTTTFTLPPEVNFVTALQGECKQLTAVSPEVICTTTTALPPNGQLTYTVIADAITPTTTASCRVEVSNDPGDDGTHVDVATVGTTITSGDPDADGVPDAIEAGAPNGGDGNGDGVPDKDQPDVSSQRTSRGDYVTLVASAGALKSVTTQTPPTPTPSGVAFPVDALSYEVAGLAPGATTTVTLHLSAGIPAFAYWKFGPEPGNTTPHWYDFSFDGTTGAVKTGPRTLTITLVDGGRGDDDLTANGTVVDPGAPALRRLVVDTLGGASDLAAGDGVCDAGGGACTLRAAIEESNANADAFYVAFTVADADGFPGIELPIDGTAVTAPVVIDGATHPDYAGAPIIAVQNGTPWSITGGASSLRAVSTGAVTIAGNGGVCVTDAIVAGMTLDGVGDSVVRRSRVFGPAILGAGAVGNRFLDNDVPVGGLTLVDAQDTEVRGNAIYQSGAALSGVDISGADAAGNVVAANFIGLDPDGACTSYGNDPATNTPGAGPCVGGNGGWGVRLSGGAHDNLVGGEGTREGNLISANALGGVLVAAGAHTNTVAGNLFGTDRSGLAERHPVSGTYQLENGGPCVMVEAAPGNVIGGASAAARNICAGRGVAIVDAASIGNRVGHNWIMLDARGDVPWVRLSLDDVLLVRDAVDTVVHDNVVPTIEVSGAATGTRITDNLVGTDVSGTRAFYADTSIPGTTRVWSRGLLVHGSAYDTRAAGNTFSGSYLYGVDVWEQATLTALVDNRVGVDVTGLAPLPNYKGGVHIDARFGGSAADALVAGNVIAANNPAGVFAFEADYPYPAVHVRGGAARATIRDNTIGLAADAITPLGCPGHGIYASGAPDVTITGNLVGACAGDGVRLDDGVSGIPVASVNAVIRGNVIGTDALGLVDLGNGGHGVHVNVTSGVQIGGDAPGDANTIAHNGGAGVWVEAGGVGNTVRGNRAWDNRFLGFDLSFLGVDPNDGGAGFGTNDGIDHPVLTAATTTAPGAATVAGTLQHAANTAYTLDFYRDTAPDPSAHGEGRAWLGATQVTTDPAGAATFSAVVSLDGTDGRFISATVTDPAGNTSEHSAYAWLDAAPAWADVGISLGHQADIDQACVDGGIAYSATLTVLGPDPASDVVVTFTYPAGVAYTSISGGPLSCSVSEPTVTCTAASLAPGTYNLFPYGAVSAAAAGDATATVTVSHATTDPNPANASASVVTRVGAADLGVAITAPPAAAVGEPFDVGVTVASSAASPCYVSPRITAPLPAGVQLVGSDPAGACVEAAGAVTCDLPSIYDAEEHVTLRLVADATGDFPLAVTVSHAGPDTAPADNTAATVVSVREAVHDLATTLVAVPATPEIGAPFDYVVTVTNAGPSAAADVVLTETLPALAVPGDLTSTHGACVLTTADGGEPDRTVSCALGTLASGEQATITVSALSEVGGVLAHEACAEALGDDLDPSDDCASDDTTVGAVDLTPALSATPDPATTNTPFTLTVRVDNAGPTTARAAGFRMTLPYNVPAPGFDPELGCVVIPNPELQVDEAHCTLGDVPAGGSLGTDVSVTATEGTQVFTQITTTTAAFDTATFNDAAGITVGLTAPASGCPDGRVRATLLPDDTETGGAGWEHSYFDFCGAGCELPVFALATDAAYDGAASWHVPDVAVASSLFWMSPPIDLSGDITNPQVVFWHRYDFEAGVDGARIAVSENNGLSWRPADYLANGPVAPVSSFGASPGYTGVSPAWPAFEESRADLAFHASHSVRVALAIATNSSVGGPGWWVDGVTVEACVPGVVETDADVSVALSGPETATVLTPLAYAVAVDNAGPVAATGLTVRVAIDPGLALTADGCVADDAGLTCALADLAPGGQAVITLSGAATVDGVYGLTATAAAAPPDPDATNDAASLATTVTGAEQRADAQLSRLGGPTALTLGASATATYRVTNAGPEPADLTLTLAAPAHVGPTGASPTSGDCAAAGDGIVCALGTVSSGASVDVAVGLDPVATGAGFFVAAVGLTPAAPPNLIDPDGDNDVVLTELTVFLPDAAADVAVAVAADPAAVLLGDPAVVTATATNAGPDTALDVVVALTSEGPAELGPLSASGFGATCDDVAGTCVFGALQAGEAVTVSRTVTPTVLGAAAVTAAVAADTADPDATNDEATTAVTALAPVADLGVRWLSPPATVRDAEPFTLTAELSNAGPLDTDATLVVSVSEGVALLTGPATCELGARFARCPAAPLAAGEQRTSAFVALATSPGASVTVTATTTSTTTDTTADDDVAVATVAVTAASADLGLTAALMTGSPQVGAPVTVRFTVAHQAGDDAQNVRLHVGLPGGVASGVTADAGTGGSCVADAGGVACALGVLTGASAARVVDVTFTPVAPGAHVVSGSVGAATGDPAPADNFTATVVTATQPCAGAPCDDGDPCTEDTCSALGGCAHAPSAAGTACDDGDACTTADACLDGLCVGGGPTACDDGDDCTLDVCDPEVGGCTHAVAFQACDDGDACTTVDLCDAAGACLGAVALACDDGDDCTDDACAPTTGCVHVAAAGCCEGPLDCDDSNVCTVDSCDAATGDCSNAPTTEPTACDADQSVCTVDDRCEGGVCVPGAALDCGDGDVCTSDVCLAVGGCDHPPIAGCCSADADCPDADGDPCTRASCDTATGVCSLVAASDGTACDADGSVCTDGDACVAGVCQAGAALACDPGGACVTASCDPATGCVVTPMESCCEADSDCPAAAPACQAYRCVTETGTCVLEAVSDGAGCDADGTVCTVGDACAAGVCVAGPAPGCDDGDPCTEDTCDPALGCRHTVAAGAGCDDADACTTADRCDAAGACVGVALACDDGDACTADGCVDGACVYTLQPLVDVADPCGGGDEDCDGETDEDHVIVASTCGEGQCAGNTGEVRCEDGALVDTCDPFAGASDELCDAVDNDCDGTPDQGFPDTQCGEAPLVFYVTITDAAGEAVGSARCFEAGVGGPVACETEESAGGKPLLKVHPYLWCPGE